MSSPFGPLPEAAPLNRRECALLHCFHCLAACGLKALRARPPLSRDDTGVSTEHSRYPLLPVCPEEACQARSLAARCSGRGTKWTLCYWHVDGMALPPGTVGEGRAALGPRGEAPCAVSTSLGQAVVTI